MKQIKIILFEKNLPFVENVFLMTKGKGFHIEVECDTNYVFNSQDDISSVELSYRPEQRYIKIITSEYNCPLFLAVVEVLRSHYEGKLYKWNDENEENILSKS